MNCLFWEYWELTEVRVYSKTELNKCLQKLFWGTEIHQHFLLNEQLLDGAVETSLGEAHVQVKKVDFEQRPAGPKG